MTCDNINYYTQEQKAYHGGLMDMFSLLSAPGSGCLQNLNFGYYDGNTVTALWNYAQYFTLEDNFFASTFGTTVMGHLNLLAGQTHGATPPNIAGKVVNGSVISNIDPTDDDCSSGSTIVMSGPTVGDLLNAKGITWGWFYGDWTPIGISDGEAICSSDYDAHYAPFQYYASTANPHHLPPTSISRIGQTDRANHQYDISDFWAAVANGNMPAVTFLASAYQDRCGYGPRLAFLVLSPYARKNYVDHSLEDMTSILRFIEDNWGLGQIGDQSFDSEAGSILNAFGFSRPGPSEPLILDPQSGEIVSGGK
jgi:phospholipase C